MEEKSGMRVAMILNFFHSSSFKRESPHVERDSSEPRGVERGVYDRRRFRARRGDREVSSLDGYGRVLEVVGFFFRRREGGRMASVEVEARVNGLDIWEGGRLDFVEGLEGVAGKGGGGGEVGGGVGGSAVLRLGDSSPFGALRGKQLVSRVG